jgi:hypothetical protein
MVKESIELAMTYTEAVVGELLKIKGMTGELKGAAYEKPGEAANEEPDIPFDTTATKLTRQVGILCKPVFQNCLSG